MNGCRIGALIAALVAPVEAQGVVNEKISGPMVSGTVGDAFLPSISPDGSAVLYALSRSSDVLPSELVSQLAVAPMDGSGDPVLLSPLDGTRLTWMRWTPDGTRAVYIVEEPTTNAPEQLFVVPTDGSAPPIALSPIVRIVSPLDESVQLTADGSHVVYHVHSESNLFSVPIDGSAPPVALNGPLASGGFVASFRVSPSGSRVVYCGDEETDEVVGLFSAPADGSAARIKISHALASGEDVQASGTRVVYCAGTSISRNDIYSVPVDGSAAAMAADAGFRD